MFSIDNQIIRFLLIMIMISAFFFFLKRMCTVEITYEKKVPFSLKGISIVVMLCSLIYALKTGSYIFVYMLGLEMLSKLVILFVKKRWTDFINILVRTIIYALLLYLCNEIIFNFIFN